MDEEEKKEDDKGDNPSLQEGDVEVSRELSERDGIEVPSGQDGSSEASEVFSEDPLKLLAEEKQEDEELEDEVKLRILRCLTSSFLAGARCSLHSKKKLFYIHTFSCFCNYKLATDPQQN